MEFHHIDSTSDTLTHLVGGKLDANTLYRLGSVEKLFTVYTFIAKLGTKYWSEPVTRFIPELTDSPTENSVTTFNWSAVTLGSLAGQINGRPKYCKFGGCCIKTLPRLDKRLTPSHKMGSLIIKYGRHNRSWVSSDRCLRNHNVRRIRPRSLFQSRCCAP
jgi:hypothetical protein